MRIEVTAGLLMVVAGAVLAALAAFGVADNDTVHLGWLGAALAFVGLKVP